MIPYTNRELSWLDFNQRVLEQSKREDLPVLERVKFLAITGANLDEFYQVRIGGLTQNLHNETLQEDRSGLSANAQLHEMRARSATMMAEQYEHWNKVLRPQLAKDGIEFLSFHELDNQQAVTLERVAQNDFLPILTPIALQYEEFNINIPAMQILLVARLKCAEEVRHVLIPIPKNLPRFVSVEPHDPEVQPYLMIEDLVAHHLPIIFPGEEIDEVGAFRLTKNSDIVLSDEDARDLAGEMKEVLTQRRFGDAVRVEHSAEMSAELMEVIGTQTGAQPAYFSAIDGPLGFADFFALTGVLGFENLKIKPWTPVPSPAFLEHDSVFDALDAQSVTLFHPYESFDPVVKMLSEAADDPNTLAIKQILYRTASKSRIIEALIKAALKGKHVTVLIELKARFDEERNLNRAEELRRAGVQVIYGVKGYKTHAKATLIIRKTERGIKRYVHFGTGNYNEATANIYTDISYLTCNKQLGNEASLFFNMITGHSKVTRFQELSPAPTHMKSQIIELIEAEAANAKKGIPARILGKMNSLQDPEVIEALYMASQAGVRIKLNVRGICCLVPGVKGHSENITVVSIIDRYLEHTRAFYFEQSGEKKVFISSADWMVRNLQKRLELMVPIEDKFNRDRIIDYLKDCFRDNTNAYHLTADGGFEKRTKNKAKPFRFQKHLHDEAQAAHKAYKEKNASQFQPHIDDA